MLLESSQTWRENPRGKVSVRVAHAARSCGTVNRFNPRLHDEKRLRTALLGRLCIIRYDLKDSIKDRTRPCLLEPP